MAAPQRQVTGATIGSMDSDAAVPGEDARETSGLLGERLEAWLCACQYLEKYVSATEKAEKSNAKEYEKVLKTLSTPLKHGHHFDQALGGIAGLFENMRANTEGLVNSHAETEKNLHGSVLPILERLHKEIKNKSKELSGGIGKNAKEVEKARNLTQKHIELLGQHSAAFSSSGGKNTPETDPYVLQRGVFHRLGKQVVEENNSRQDLISVQNNFAQFEAHVVEVLQQAMASFNQFVGGQVQKDAQLYAEMLATAQRIPPDLEWNGFVQRNSHMLIDPNAGPRTVDGIQFPNMNHDSTKPLIEGTLERKSRNKLALGGSYSSGYYVVTPSKYLHEFKDADNSRTDPVPEISIYLPDATIGATNGPKFNVKGKDVSKGLMSKLSGSSELHFKAHSAADAELWFNVIRQAAGNSPTEAYDGSDEDGGTVGSGSALPSRSASTATQPHTFAYQGAGTQGAVTDEPVVASPVEKTG